MLGQPLEGAGPAALMAITLFDRGEDRLAEGHPRLALLGSEGDRDQRLMTGAAGLVVPGEGEDEALGLDDFAIDAAVPELLAGLVAPQAEPPGTARPQVALDMRRREAARTHPAFGGGGIAPRLEDGARRRIEDAGDDEHPIILSVGILSVGILSVGEFRLSVCRHAFSPWLATRAGSRPGDRSSPPRSGDRSRAIEWRP